MAIVNNMPRKTFSEEMELRFMQSWHDILLAKQGTMTSQSEKISLCLVGLNRYAKEVGHPDLSIDQVKNKLDSLRAKAKRIYAEVRRKTTTGSLVEDDFDLEVST